MFWWGFRYLHSAELTNKNSQLKLIKDQLGDYQRKLDVDSSEIEHLRYPSARRSGRQPEPLLYGLYQQMATPRTPRKSDTAATIPGRCAHRSGHRAGHHPQASSPPPPGNSRAGSSRRWSASPRRYRRRSGSSSKSLAQRGSGRGPDNHLAVSPASRAHTHITLAMPHLHSLA